MKTFFPFLESCLVLEIFYSNHHKFRCILYPKIRFELTYVRSSENIRLATLPDESYNLKVAAVEEKKSLVERSKLIITNLDRKIL